MARADVKLNRAAAARFLKSPEVLADLQARADRIANAAGPGFAVDSGISRSRARASVRTADWQARVAEAKTGALTRSIDAGR